MKQTVAGLNTVEMLLEFAWYQFYFFRENHYLKQTFMSHLGQAHNATLLHTYCKFDAKLSILCGPAEI